MTTLAFWSADRTQELSRESQTCPVRGCGNQVHPVRTLYQRKTNEPGLTWECDRGHQFFACHVQDFNPLPHMRTR